MELAFADRLRPASAKLVLKYFDHDKNRGLKGFRPLGFEDLYFERSRDVMVAIANSVSISHSSVPSHEAMGFAKIEEGATDRLNQLNMAFLRYPELFPGEMEWLAHAAALAAQEDFALRFSGMGSHEERLTGHWISSLVTASETVTRLALAECQANAWHDKILRQRISSGNLFHYVDVAMANKEKETGADIGLILCVRIQHRRYFRPFRLQAKKAKGSGRANIRYRNDDPLGQAAKLQQSGIGFYLYYFQRDMKSSDANVIPAPIIQPATAVDGMTATNVDILEDSLDTATFLLKHMCRTETDRHDYLRVEHAVAALMASSDEPPSGIMTFGAVEHRYDLVTRMEQMVAACTRDLAFKHTVSRQESPATQAHPAQRETSSEKENTNDNKSGSSDGFDF